jgi:hypothetical protein
MQVVIEKNVPVPTYAGKTKPLSPATLAIMTMQVGDSYLIPKNDKVRNRYQYVAKTRNWKFITRTTEQGVRVWRIA